MIRRLFWLTLGAVLGITGYRRATALARSVPGALRARELATFAADVREGMALYARRHSPPEGSTLEGQAGRGVPGDGSAGHARARTDDERDGR